MKKTLFICSVIAIIVAATLLSIASHDTRHETSIASNIFKDTDFGFSYTALPSEDVEATTSGLTDSRLYGEDTHVEKAIRTSDLIIDEVISPKEYILSSAGAGPLNSDTDRYFFDEATDRWMHVNDNEATGKLTTSVAKVASTTLGGLPIFGGYKRFGNMMIIPISPTHILSIISVCNDASDIPCSGTDRLERYWSALRRISPLQ